MNIMARFPRSVREIENVFIPLKDGTKLAARIWLPEDAEADPVPAVLEYLPYRKRDGTIERDSLVHPYFAGYGYAGVRVDIRGSGDSEGVLLGEYLKQEQDDGLEIIEWIASQPWCTGAVGMIGISWGGFNGLQMAARRPPALKAIVSVCSTDDRYADDIHYMGGCLLLDKITWGSTMFSLNTAPPDPLIVGERWREMWMKRLEESGFWIEHWLGHQRRDDFYKHGSVCEDWSKIECPVYMIGGWADGYSNAVPRLLANLKAPRKGLIGPWAHKYPHFAKPGPQIGFLQECIRWWDHWLKGKPNGIMDEPLLRVWMEDPARPAPQYDERPGRWVAEHAWPSSRIEPVVRPLLDGRLGAPGEVGESTFVTICSPQNVGLAAAKWCPYGAFPDQSLDQRMEAGGQLLFDSEPLQEDFEILGPPVLDLTLSSDRPNAQIAATLSEVFPDGAATRVTYGLLNLTHRNSHENPEALEPDRQYRVRVQLNDTAHRFGAGNRIRVALSTAYWPLAWTSPETVTLSIRTGESALSLPIRPANSSDAQLTDLPPPDSCEAVKQTYTKAAHNAWTITHDAFTDETTVVRASDEGVRVVDDISLEVAVGREYAWRIKADDPLSARLDTHWRRAYSRGDWRISSDTRITVTSTADHFVVEAKLTAYESDNEVFTRTWSPRIPRDHV